MPRRIDELFYDITARTGGFERGIASSQRGLRGFVGKLGTATTAFAAFGAAAVAAGIKATRMAASLDSALREVATLLPGTVSNIERLRSEVVALSTEVPQTPELLSRGLYQVISTGISDTAEAMDVLKVAAQAATAGLTDTFTSVDAITTVLNAYQLETSEAARVSDVFFTTIREGKLTFGDIASNIGTVATSASLAGVSIEEVGAALATLTKFGIGTAEAATSLNRLFLSLTNVTDDAAAAARDMGVELSTAALRSKGLVGFLEDLERATGGNLDALSQLIPEIRAARGVFVLAGQGADEYRRVLEETGGAAGSTGEAFTAMNGSLENQATLLKNRVNAAWLALGEKTLPLVLGALRAINTLLESDAERLSRAFETLGLQAQAAAVIVAEQRRKIAAAISESDRELRRDLQGVIDRQQLQRPAGVSPLAGLPADVLDSLFPRELETALDQGADAQRRIVDETVKFARATADASDPLGLNLDLTREQAIELARIVEERVRLRGELDQQVARERELLDLATSRAGVEEDDGPDPDPTPKLTEAERKALDLRDALLEANDALAEIGASGADLFSEVPGVLDDVNRRIREMGEGLEADFGEFSLDARLLAAQRAIEGVTRSGASFGQQALAVQGILDQWGISVDQLPPGFRQVVQAILDARGAAEETNEEIRELINDISFAARGAVELANAFGLVGDEAAQVVNQVALIGEGIGRIAAGDILGGVGGVLSGIAGVIGGLFGGDSGPSESEIARDESLRDNTRRIRELNDRLAVLGSILRGLPGDITADLTEALREAIPTLEGASGGGLSGPGRRLRAEDVVRRIFESLGVSVTDLESSADAFGLDVDQLVRLLDGDPLNKAAFDEALQQARSLAEVLGRSLSEVLDTVQGRLSLLRDSFDVLDIESPAERIQLLADELARAGTALSAIDIQRLREGDEEFIEALFRQLQSGTGRFTTVGAFGDLSFDEFLDVLREIESLQDRVADAIEAESEDGFQQVSAVDRATSFQFDRALALDGTRNLLLEQIRDSLRGSPVTVTDTMLARASTVRIEGTVRHVVDVRGDASGITADAAAALGREFGRAANLDLDLGDEVRRIQQGFGFPPTREQ